MDHAAALDAKAALQHNAHSFGIDAMLFFQDARGERLRRIVIEHGHDGLQDNRPGVDILIHKVYRATGISHAVFQSLALCLEPRKRRQQGWWMFKMRL